MSIASGRYPIIKSKSRRFAKRPVTGLAEV